MRELARPAISRRSQAIDCSLAVAEDFEFNGQTGPSNRSLQQVDIVGAILYPKNGERRVFHVKFSADAQVLSTGKVNLNVVPLPSSDSTQICPSCNSTIFLQ